jgi:hypothetical protein
MRLAQILICLSAIVFSSGKLWAASYCITEVAGSNICPQTGAGWINTLENVEAPGVGVAVHSPGFSGSSAKFDDAFSEAAKKWTFKHRNGSLEEVSNFRYEPIDGVADPCPGNNATAGWDFTSDVCGNAFGAGVIAITRIWADFNANNDTTLSRIYDADMFFNTAVEWDVYDGPRRVKKDFARTALHELGHALGLGHSSTSHIMYPFVTDTETTSLSAGDEDGLAALYGVIEIPVSMKLIVAPVNFLLLN